MSLSAWLRRVRCRLFGESWGEETVRMYRESFPGLCPLCGYDRWGRQHGHDVPPRVLADHKCAFTCVEGVCHYERGDGGHP